jgi:hypothetical protein
MTEPQDHMGVTFWPCKTVLVGSHTALLALAADELPCQAWPVLQYASPAAQGVQYIAPTTCFPGHAFTATSGYQSIIPIQLSLSGKPSHRKYRMG